MNILLVVAHFFRPQEGGIYSSTNASARDARRLALEQMLLWWRASIGESTSIDIGQKRFVVQPPVADRLDIVVLVNEDNHLLSQDVVDRFKLQVWRVRTPQPRLLPFGAHRVMAERRGGYDWFVYSEDDLVMRDPLFFSKLADFQRRFGPGRVLQPNRFEVNPQALRFKTYVDGDLRPGFIDPWLARVPEASPRLALETMGREVEFVRARNPHSGCFTLSTEQVDLWARQPHFMDMDCSFVSPLESAATGALLKTFSLFKPAPANPGFLEVEHLDRKFSSLKLRASG